MIENLVDFAVEGAAQRFSFVFTVDDGACKEQGEGRIASKDLSNQLLQLVQYFLRLLPFVGCSQQRFRVDAGDVSSGVVENGGVMDLLALGHE